MSHFYGMLQGSRGGTTRCGTRASGVTTYAASWNGAIRTKVYQDENGKDRYRVERVPWQGAGDYALLAEGEFKPEG